VGEERIEKEREQMRAGVGYELDGSTLSDELGDLRSPLLRSIEYVGEAGGPRILWSEIGLPSLFHTLTTFLACELCWVGLHLAPAVFGIESSGGIPLSLLDLL
jgi:hypothetical protein